MQHRLQARISSYTGKPVTVYALYDDSINRCEIGKIGLSNAPKVDGGILISDRNADGCDHVFSDDSIIDAICMFDEMQRMGAINIRDGVMAANPRSGFEYGGIKDGKREYRIMPSITNTQMATLAIAHYLSRVRGIERQLAMVDAFSALYDGESITI